MTSILTKDFSDLTREMKALGLDLYEVKHPKVKIDAALGEQLRQHFLAMQMVMSGIPVREATAMVQGTVAFGFKEQNKGRSFNFWHFIHDQMGEMKTTENYHYGECVIRRGMVDPNQPEDLIQVFCYPYIAQGGKFIDPVLNRILDHYGVEEMKITTKISR